MPEDHIKIDSCFSSSYLQARDKFLDAAAATGIIPTHYELDLPGLQNEELATHTILIGDPNANRILILVSGTHGIEGLCGSAIQTALLRDKFLYKVPQKTAVLFVHALNPYGFSHLHRADSKNVDVNRNFIDFSSPYANDDYKRIAQALARGPTLRGWGASRVQLIAYSVIHGRRALQDAITRGQYHEPDGLFFGGRTASWSNETWNRIISDRRLANARVFILDYHTGLGPPGNGTIISPTPKDSWCSRFLETCFGESDVEYFDDEDSIVTMPTGDLISFTLRTLPSGRCAGAYLEFGTLPGLSVLDALIADNWLRAQSDVQQSIHDYIKKKLRQAFNPNDRSWRELIWDRAKQVTAAALVGLTQMN